MYEEAVIGKGFTLVIPKAVREELSLREGQRVLVRVEGRRVIVDPLPLDPYEVLEQVVGEPYDEGRDEARAEEWLRAD